MSNRAPEIHLLRDILMLVLLGGLVVIPSMATRELWSPDEPRYVEVAREMIARSDYLVPHLNGEAYAEKPPLFFWLAAAFYRCGCGYNAGRVVAGLAAIGTVLLVYFFARRHWPSPAPLLAGLAMLMSLLFLSHARLGVLDPLFAFLTTAAILAGHRALHSQRGSGAAAGWWLAFYGTVGLAVLTKGHVGLFVPGVVVLAYALLNRRQVWGGGHWHAFGAVLLLVIVGAWLVPAGIVGGKSYLYNLTVRQLVGRVIPSAGGHRLQIHPQPFYHYALQYLWFAFPWTLLFPLAATEAAVAWRQRHNEAALFALFWFIAVCVLFSIPAGKRAGYLLPLAPAMGLLMGHYLGVGTVEGWRFPRIHRHLLLATFFLAALVLLILTATAFTSVWTPDVVVRFVPQYAPLVAEVRGEMGMLMRLFGIVAALTLAVVAIAGAWVLLRTRRALLSLICLAAVLFGVSLYADIFVLAPISRARSERRLCEAAALDLAEADALYTLDPSLAGVYNLYTRRISIPVIGNHLAAALEEPRRVVVIGSEDNFRRFAPAALERYRVVARLQIRPEAKVVLANWNRDTPGP